jgi:hypothetical protein
LDERRQWAKRESEGVKEYNEQADVDTEEIAAAEKLGAQSKKMSRSKKQVDGQEEEDGMTVIFAEGLAEGQTLPLAEEGLVWQPWMEEMIRAAAEEERPPMEENAPTPGAEAADAAEAPMEVERPPPPGAEAEMEVEWPSAP